MGASQLGCVAAARSLRLPIAPAATYPDSHGNLGRRAEIDTNVFGRTQTLCLPIRTLTTRKAPSTGRATSNSHSNELASNVLSSDTLDKEGLLLCEPTRTFHRTES
jgi:hypothetical protein